MGGHRRQTNRRCEGGFRADQLAQWVDVEGLWTPWPHRRTELVELRERSREVVLLAAVVGAIVGLFVAALDHLIVEEMQDRLFEAPLAVLAVLPSIGLAISWLMLRTIGRRASSSTSDEYLHAFHDRSYQLAERPLAARLLAAVATLGTGTPMGLEGPSLYTGSAIGAALQRRLPRAFATADRRTLMVAGAAAGVAAVFKTPLTGVVFALEVPYRDDLARRMLLPALVSSASGYLVFVTINGTEPLFRIVGNPEFTLADLGGSIALGLVAGLLARLFAKLIRHAKQLSSAPPQWRIPIAGAVIAGTFVGGRLTTGENLALTSGYNVIEWALTDDRVWWALVAIGTLRVIGTAAAVAGGGAGGVFIPLVCAGVLVGRFFAEIVPGEGDVLLFGVVGGAAFLGAGYRVPLAAVCFVAEATGRPGFIVPGLLAAVAAELVMGPASITAFQADAGVIPGIPRGG